MLKYLMLVAIVGRSSFMHPIHVSICDIAYDEERDALEFVQRVFLDDLELAIRQKTGAPRLDITQPDNGKTTDELVKAYLQEHFKVTVNGKETDYNYLGHEIEIDAIYCYMEIEKVRKVNSIAIFSDILTSIFDDQVNLVHVTVDDEIRSMKLTGDRKSDELEYDD
ncbi:MAG: DUF6702 family protein [Fulvivirga sp.]